MQANTTSLPRSWQSWQTPATTPTSALLVIGDLDTNSESSIVAFQLQIPGLACCGTWSWMLSLRLSTDLLSTKLASPRGRHCFYTATTSRSMSSLNRWSRIGLASKPWKQSMHLGPNHSCTGPFSTNDVCSNWSCVWKRKTGWIQRGTIHSQPHAASNWNIIICLCIINIYIYISIYIYMYIHIYIYISKYIYTYTYIYIYILPIIYYLLYIACWLPIDCPWYTYVLP